MKPSLKKLFSRKTKDKVKLFLAKTRLEKDRKAGRKTVAFYLPDYFRLQYLTPIIEALRSDADVTCYIVAGGGRGPADLPDVGVPRSHLLELHIATHLEFDAMISPTQWMDVEYDIPSPLQICIFHGLPSKGNTFIAEKMGEFTHLFFLGPLHRTLFEEFAAAHPDIARSMEPLDVGYPKLDKLVQGAYSRETTLNQLGLDSKKKVVLFAPAFDKGASLSMFGDRIFENLLKLDVNVLVKLAPATCTRDPRYPNEIFWPDRLKAYENRPNFRYINAQQIDFLLPASDIMVTDVSGVAFEFMFFDRPLIYIDCPDFFTKTLGGKNYPNEAARVQQDIRMNVGRSAGLIVPNPEALPEAVARCLKNPGEFSSRRQAIRDQLLYNPGRGTETAVRMLKKLLAESSHPKKQK